MPLYNPQYNPTNYPQNQYQVNNHYGINWAQGIEGAKAFQLPAGTNAVILDSENEGVFYIKTSDNVGMCSLRSFQFTEITDKVNQKINPDEYVKKSELESLLNSILGGTNEQSISTAQSSKTITK